LRTGTCVRSLAGLKAAVQDLCFSPDGSMVLAGGDDNRAAVFTWDGS
jgi:hypothetical protein